MLWLFLIILLVVIGVPAVWRASSKGEEGWAWFGGIAWAMAAILLVVMFWFSFRNGFKQIVSQEKYTMLQQQEIIYQERADSLGYEFTKFLADKYPEHERDIFRSMSSQDYSLYLVKYPELKSVETVSLLVEKINTLQDDYYDIRLEKTKVLTAMRVRLRNPWLLQWIIRLIAGEEIPGEITGVEILEE